MTDGSAPRPNSLPPGVSPYRKIGPFDRSSLPSGLLKTHRLAEGVWALLTLDEGSVVFVWEDAEGGHTALSAPASILVPPGVPHYLRADAEFSLSLTFHR